MESIQGMGCQLLMNLTQAGSSDEENDEFILSVAKAGGLEAAIEEGLDLEMEGEELLVVYLGPVGHSRTVLTDKGSSGVSGGAEGRAAVGAWLLMRSRHVGAALQ